MRNGEWGGDGAQVKTCIGLGRVNGMGVGVGCLLAGRLFSFFFFLFVFCLFRAAPAAYGGSQARGSVGATAAGLHPSHSNAGSLTQGSSLSPHGYY